MKTRTILTGLGVGLLMCCGCQQPQGGPPEGLPPRAAELDRLNDWAGTWNSTYTMTTFQNGSAMKPVESTGTETAAWSCGERYLKSECEYDMGDMGKMHGVSMVTWCPEKKKFVSWWFDNFGSQQTGTMWWDDENREWKMKSNGMSPEGSKTTGMGTSRFVDPNTMEWTYTEYKNTLFGKEKLMEFKGTSKRG